MRLGLVAKASNTPMTRTTKMRKKNLRMSTMKLARPARQIVTEKFFPRKRKGVHLLSEVSQSKRPRRHRQRLHPRRNSLSRLVSPALEDPKRLTRRSPRKELVEKKKCMNLYSS